MWKILGILVSSSVLCFAQKPLRHCEKGELIFQEDCDSLAPNLKSGAGQWEIVKDKKGKHLRGIELAEDNHTGFRKMFLDHTDVVYQFDIQFEEEAYGRFIINYELVHLASLDFKLDGMSLKKNSETKKRKMMAAQARKKGLPVEKGDWETKNIVLAKQKLRLKPGKWYTVTIEMLEDTITVHMDGKTMTGKHEGMKQRKTNFGVQVSGQNDYIHYDNIKIWAAKKK